MQNILLIGDVHTKIENYYSILKENNASFEFSAGYPEWKFRAESKLREKALEVYKKLYNKDMKVEVTYIEPKSIEKVKNVFIKDSTCESELKAYQELFNE